MSDPTSTRTGTVLPTPEAGPLTPPTMRAHYAPDATVNETPEGSVSVLPATIPAEPLTAGTTPAGKAASPREDAAHDLGERLKPVMEAAEDVAAKALDLSARGLSKLADALEERRGNRG